MDLKSKTGLGQLRHLYKNMIDGRIHPAYMTEAANGLLAPGIEELEAAHKRIEELEQKVSELLDEIYYE